MKYVCIMPQASNYAQYVIDIEQFSMPDFKKITPLHCTSPPEEYSLLQSLWTSMPAEPLISSLSNLPANDSEDAAIKSIAFKTAIRIIKLDPKHNRGFFAIVQLDDTKKHTHSVKLSDVHSLINKEDFIIKEYIPTIAIETLRPSTEKTSLPL